jgi:hypothetical protein
VRNRGSPPNMSFDVYLQCHREGQPAGIPRAAVRRLFPVVDAKSEPSYWRLQYDAEPYFCNMLVEPLHLNPEMLHSISVNRPTGGMRFYASVLAVLLLGNVLFYFPGCPGPIVA